MPDADVEKLRGQLTDIYANYRNICLSKKYYELLLARTERANFWYEVIIAVGTSTAVAGWAFWKFPIADTVWPVFGGVVAILAVIKPIVAFTPRIERFTSLATYYSSLLIDFQALIFEIKTKERIDPAAYKVYSGLLNKLKALPAKEDPNPSEKVLREITKRVNREIPADSLWHPK